ncbi:hypothetical protein ACS0TY_030644 [Phlomoides rotata]
MFRALSSRRSGRGYDQLLVDHDDKPSSSAASSEPKLSRAKSLMSCNSKKINTPSPHEQVKKGSKVHPFFSLFETRRKKKPTASPQFSRYLQYVKEGGGGYIYGN